MNTSDRPTVPPAPATVPPSDKPEPPPHQPSKDFNILGSIKQFADHQLTSILQSVFGLPSSTTAPKTSNWAVFDEEPATPGEEESLRQLAAKRTRSASSGILEEVQSRQTFSPSRNSTDGGGANDKLRVSSEIDAAKRRSDGGPNRD